MLVKGCSRRMIMVKDTGSRYFDSVYFILRSELPRGTGESDMVRAAQALLTPTEIGAASAPEPQKRHSKRLYGLVAYLSGAATVGMIAGILALIFG